MIEEMALEYFRSMPKAERKRLVKKIFSSLSEDEKLDLAKMIVGKK